MDMDDNKFNFNLGDEPIATPSKDITNSEETVFDNNINTNVDINDSNADDRPPTDRNKITVHVVDKKAPIILLFGAASSGKTMTMVRLGKYLKKTGVYFKRRYKFLYRCMGVRSEY